MRIAVGALVVEVEIVGGKLIVNGEEKYLRPNALKILRYLIRHRGEIRSKKEICKAVWRRRATPERKNEVEAYVNEIRQALGEGDIGYKLLETRDLFGYLFDPEYPSDPALHPGSISKAGIVYLPKAKRFFVRGNEVIFTPSEFGVLEYLITHDGVCSREKLTDYVWDDNRTQYDSLYRAIGHIRRKVEIDPKLEPKIIVSIGSKGSKGYEGYRLNPEPQ